MTRITADAEIIISIKHNRHNWQFPIYAECIFDKEDATFEYPEEYSVIAITELYSIGRKTDFKWLDSLFSIVDDKIDFGDIDIIAVEEIF